MTTLTERSEILFLYQIRDCNPNGDPLEENQPRVDPETGVATVSDVRIKRTIRDYWKDVLGKEIWIRNGMNDDGLPESAPSRMAAFEGQYQAAKGQAASLRKLVLEHCLDARTFGCILAVAKSGKKPPTKKDPAIKKEDDADSKSPSEIAITGPIQFSGFNRSLHRVAPQFIQGTAAFASGENKKNKSFRTDHLLPYGLIAVYGVLNEVSARATNMTVEDRELLLEGLWRGTEHLHSRSKMGHQPIALLELSSSTRHRIGDLPSRMRLVPRDGIEEIALRGLDQFILDASELGAAIGSAASAGRLTRIRYRQDPRLQIEAGAEPFVQVLTRLRTADITVESEAFAAW